MSAKREGIYELGDRPGSMVEKQNLAQRERLVGRPHRRRAPKTVEEWRERAPEETATMSDEEILELGEVLERLASVALRTMVGQLED